MNKNTSNRGRDVSPLPAIQFGQQPARSTPYDQPISRLLDDEQALIQWQCGLAQLRQQDELQQN